MLQIKIHPVLRICNGCVSLQEFKRGRTLKPASHNVVGNDKRDGSESGKK